MAESADITARDARQAAELEPDVGAEQIGEVYAKALLGAAAGRAARRARRTRRLVDEVFAAVPPAGNDPGLGPGLAPREVGRSGPRVCRARFVPVLLHFLKVVSRHGRLDCLRAIRRQAHRAVRRAAGPRPRAGDHGRAVRTRPWPAARPTASAAIWAASRSWKPEVDPELIGGAVLRVGDTVYDGSDRQPIANHPSTDDRQERP